MTVTISVPSLVVSLMTSPASKINTPRMPPPISSSFLWALKWIRSGAVAFFGRTDFFGAKETSMRKFVRPESMDEPSDCCVLTDGS